MKKIAFIILAMLLPILPIMADELTFTVDGLNYQHLGGLNQAVRLLGYKGDKCPQKVIIPATVSNAGKTYSVDVISSDAFLGCVDLISVEMESSGDNGVKYIDPNSFAGCTNLSKVGFSKVLEAINAPGYSGQKGAFEGCTSLKTIVLPASMDYKGEVDATAPHNICKWAFKNCTGLKTVIINASRPYIEDEAFVNCSSLQYFVSYNTHPWSLEWNTFQGIPSTANLIVPDGTKSTYQALLGWNAFNNIDEHSNVDLKAILGEEDQPQGGGTAKLSIQDFTIKAGETKTMLIDMQNPDDQVTLVQFDLRLPDGLSISTGNDATDIAGRTTWRKHTLTSNATNGVTRIMLYSATNEVIEGTSGAIISIKLTASSLFNGGDIKLENQLMTTPSLVESKPATYSYNIKGGGVTPPAGDAEAYVVYNNGTLTFYCDNKRSSRQGTAYDLTPGEWDLPKWKDLNGSVIKAVFDPSFANARPKTTKCWFDDCMLLTEIQGISYLNTNEVTNMCAMFSNCRKLTSLDLSNFNTDKVTDMAWMFGFCESLTSLDMSKFNTENVTDMEYMFRYCRNLTSLDVSKFNTANVTTMGNMFSDCRNLTSLDLSSFDTNALKTDSPWAPIGAGGFAIVQMFDECRNLSKLILGSGFSTKEGIRCDEVFNNCYKLNTVVFTGDIPATINSLFFEGVGTSDAPATLHVPDAYKANYQAKFDGNKFFGGYFKLSGDNPPAGDGEPYVVYNNGTLTFYCDNQRSSRQGTTYDLNEGNEAAEWTKNHWDAITKAVIDASFANAKPTSTCTWFCLCRNLTKIEGLHYLNTSNVTNMQSMFSNCSELKNLDLSTFNTEKVATMANMFYSCKNLESISMSSLFNTKNVTDMNSMFGWCSSLTSLDLSKFNTSNVTDMGFMFYYCSGLISLDLSKFDTSNVTDMGSMFSNCSSLVSLDVSGFKTSNATYMYNMFECCSSLTNLDVSNFNTSNVTYMGRMFLDCSSLASLDVRGFDTSNAIDMSNMFFGCRGLTNLDVSKFNTRNVTDMALLFNGCSGLTSLDVSGFNTSNVTNMYGMFGGCSGLTSLDVSGFNTSNVTSMPWMFAGCSSLTSLIMGSQFTSNESTESDEIFTDCPKLSKVTYTGNIPSSINSKFFEGVGTADTPAMLKIPDAYKANYQAKFDGNMFFGGYFKLSGDNPSVSEKPYVVYNDFTLTFYCDDLRSKRSGTIYSLNEGEAEPEWVLDDNNRNVEKVVFDASFAKARPTSTFQWFFYCDYLTEIKGMENLNTSEVKTMRAMFGSCKHLKSVDVSHFDTKAVLDMGAMFSSCTSLESIDVGHFDSNNVWSMISMFNNCQSLTEINLSSFNTSNVEYLSYLFNGCNNLKTVYLGSGFVSDNSIECEEAFAGCQNLSKVVFTGDVPTDINSSFFVGVGTASKPAKLDVPEQYVANYEAKFVGNMFYGGYFTLREAIVPDEKGGKDYGSGNSEIDEKTNLDGSVIGNVYYSIAPENGGYNSAEGCLVVTKPSSDKAFEIDDPFGNDFKGMFTGIMIMVQQGSGIVKVEAETSGGMTLMVKVGNGLPIQMTMLSKSTLAIPYSVDRPTYIYIYAGGSNGNARTRASSDGKLKIYSISWESSASGINSPVGEEQLYDVYSLSGTLIKRRVTSLDALPKGVYIVNGRKVVVK